MKLKNMQLENVWMESQNMKKTTTLLKEQFDVEATNVKVLEEFLKANCDDYKTKCGEVEELKKTMYEIQNEGINSKRIIKGLCNQLKHKNNTEKEAAEAALYEYQEAIEENNTLMNKNNELLLKVSILERKMEERNDWKTRYEDEARKSKELNLNLERSNELLDVMSQRLGKEVAEMNKLARQDSVKAPKKKKAQRQQR